MWLASRESAHSEPRTSVQIPQDLHLFLGFRRSPALATAQSVDVEGMESETRG